MYNIQAIGVISFLALIFLSRFYHEKGMSALNPDEKVKLLDSFSNMRKYYLIPIMFLIGVFYVVKPYLSEHYLVSFFTLLAAILIFALIVSIVSYRKVKRLSLNKEYMKHYYISRAILYIGVIILFTCIGLDIYK
jgi:TRAP-type uncharacterized transport system fused permease subunit